ncbi:MAG: 1-deoxy-D-xylulose-5-phosphate synthase [Acidimicrobiales bacterium]
MLLDAVASPADLRALNRTELEALATEIRAFIVDAVNTHGGHLGSNLGVVELTLALHRVFDSPNDPILWDTGHQAYVHKIVTGRAQGFERLRQADGLSGYPSREESEHDWVENSHASTILGYAHGLATAFDLRQEHDRRVVAVVGDGSLTGGMAFEGLNNLGHSGRRVIIILNDNGRSYAPTISKLSEGLIKLRLSADLVRQQNRMKHLVRNFGAGGELLQRSWDATKAAIRELWEPRTFFEELGVRYAGPVDGHDLAELEHAMRQVRAYNDGPVLLHVLTEKGRGYAPAENDPIKKLHDMSFFKAGTYTAAFSDALIKQAEARPEVVAITAAMADSTGLLPFAERFPDRCFDVGIAEQHAVTAAAGMAMGGLRPVVALYSTFLTRAIDQVNVDVGLHRQPVVFCLDRAGITGDDGPSHHGVLDMVLLNKVPGMTVYAPSSYQELQVMLHDALEHEDGPSAIRFPKTAARNVSEDEVGVGRRARQARRGHEVCLLGVGKMLAAALDAADLLAAEGVTPTVWDVRLVKPLDPSMIADACAHDLVITIEDGLRDGGAGAAMADAIAAHAAAAGMLAPPVVILGVPDRFLAQGKPDQILAELGLDGAGVAATVRARRHLGALVGERSASSTLVS